MDRVYKYGCRPPREHDVAMQLLGQAWLYREALRLVCNRHKRRQKTRWLAELEAEHVRTYEAHLARTDDWAHVLAWSKHVAFSNEQALLNADIRAERAARGHLLDYGTYWLIEAHVLSASKACGFDPIKRQDWDETGHVGAAISSRDQFAATRWTHKRVMLTSPDNRGHAELSIVVGDLKTPRRITWPIKLHRPFPEGAIVKQVAVQRTRSGHRYRWEALLTVSYEQRRTDPDAHGVVGVDIGWRSDGELGRRVATWDSDDDCGVLHIDTERAFLYADSVRSIRDVNFDAAKAFVKSEGLPGTDHAHLWRDKARMHRLAESTGHVGPAWWRERDIHLEDIECGVRTRAQRRRRDASRRLADMLAKRHRILVLEDMPMSEWVGLGKTHAKERKRSMAALSFLQNDLVQRFGPDRVHWVPPQYTSMVCSACGVCAAGPIGPVAHWQCASCGAEHHQDDNAAINLRRLGERWIADGNTPRARTRKPKKRKGKKNADGIATGDERSMVVTAREPILEAAE